VAGLAGGGGRGTAILRLRLHKDCTGGGGGGGGAGNFGYHRMAGKRLTEWGTERWFKISTVTKKNYDLNKYPQLQWHITCFKKHSFVL
jgi:hypothetical protein